jgi:hypothetical protein
MSSSLSSSQPAWQSRPGQNYPAFPGSRVVPARQLNAQMTAYQRMLKFGSSDPPKLTKNTLESVAVDTFIKYLHQLIRADAFDDSVIINLIDSETVGLLTYYYQPTERENIRSLITGRSIGCSYDHSSFGRALPAPARASKSRSWFSMATSGS